MENKPRYSRISDIIELIILMQSRSKGICIKDIEEYFKVSRRTAERMRDSLLNIFPQIEEIEDGGKVKYWGFRNFSLASIINFSPDEISVLENVKNNANEALKDSLDKIITKLKALNNKKIKSIENEIELLLRSEGHAVRQAPNYKTDISLISDIRQAIKDNLKIKAIYNNKEKELSPLGLLYGEKIYLAAIEEKKGKSAYYYLLHKFKNIKITKETFDPQGFDMQEFANRSFGVYQSEIFDVKLKFSPVVKEDVLNYNFHPTQKIRLNKDNTTTITFKAGSNKEIIWHVFKWGNNVKIIEPKSLREEYKQYLKNVIENQ